MRLHKSRVNGVFRRHALGQLDKALINLFEHRLDRLIGCHRLAVFSRKDFDQTIILVHIVNTMFIKSLNTLVCCQAAAQTGNLLISHAVFTQDMGFDNTVTMVFFRNDIANLRNIRLCHRCLSRRFGSNRCLNSRRFDCRSICNRRINTRRITNAVNRICNCIGIGAVSIENIAQFAEQSFGVCNFFSAQRTVSRPCRSS